MMAFDITCIRFIERSGIASYLVKTYSIDLESE